MGQSSRHDYLVLFLGPHKASVLSDTGLGKDLLSCSCMLLAEFRSGLQFLTGYQPRATLSPNMAACFLKATRTMKSPERWAVQSYVCNHIHIIKHPSTFVTFYWLDTNHRSHPYSRKGDSDQKLGIMKDHPRFCWPQHTNSGLVQSAY